MADLGARRLLFTDVSRDGMLEGPNTAATIALAAAAGIPVLASGGVSGVDDVKKLAHASAQGIEGVIIGKALYAGRLNVTEAIRAARDEREDDAD
jgi:phosphoribosylformimino-5-aminoimidazole carboxamide ribotide isomerase